MTNFQAVLSDFASRQAERAAAAEAELHRLKQAVVAPLRKACIARVEIRFDGYGDSGAVEEIECADAAGQALLCPDVCVALPAEHGSEAADDAGKETLRAALENLAYLALERHFPGWENNEGAYGALVIDIAEGSFALECSLRYIATEDHSAQL